jgi:hypothetical protein
MGPLHAGVSAFSGEAEFRQFPYITRRTTTVYLYPRVCLDESREFICVSVSWLCGRETAPPAEQVLRQLSGPVSIPISRCEATAYSTQTNHIGAAKDLQMYIVIGYIYMPFFARRWEKNAKGSGCKNEKIGFTLSACKFSLKSRKTKRGSTASPQGPFTSGTSSMSTLMHAYASASYSAYCSSTPTLRKT